MQRSRHACLGLVVVALAAIVAGSKDAAAQGEPDLTTITGTIRVQGCQVAASDLMVRARPVRAPGTWSGETTVIRAAAGAAAGQFGYRFGGLETGVPYRIGVKVVGPSARICRQLAWSVDHDPLVFPGAPPLTFRGFAVRSEIEVLATTEGRATGPGPIDVDGRVHVKSPPELWVGADALNFRDASKATRRFRWRPGLPGVDGGRLQISTRPFPKIGERSYDPCRTGSESGVIRQVDFDVQADANGWTMLPSVDFNALLLSNDPDVGVFADPGLVARLDLGMPVHVRVVPIKDGRALCDPEEAGAPPEALLAAILAQAGVPSPAESKLSLGNVWYTMPDIHKHPVPGEVCYRVTRDHVLNWNPFIGSWDLTAVLNAKDADLVNGKILAGAFFCVANPSNDDGWFDSVVDTFGSVLSGIVDGLGKLVNFASDLWEDIQDKAVDAVAHAVDEVGIVDCGPESKCRAALETGLEVALASMGVPPSLPNFDELVDMGVDYVAVQIASEAGIPPEVADYASDKAQDFVKKAAADMKAAHVVPGLPDWLVPDLGFGHGYLTMELYGRGLDFPYFSRPAIIRGNSPIYAGAFIPLPQRLPKPGEKPILFPMVLPPNLNGLPEAPGNYDDYNKARVDKKYWVQQRYTGGCYHLVLTGLSDPGGIAPLRDNAFLADDQAIVPCVP